MRSPAAISKRRVAVGVQQQHAQLAAVAGVDQAGRVDERDPVAGGEAGARQHEPGVAGRGSRRRCRCRPRSARPGSMLRGVRRRRGRGRRRRRRRASGSDAPSAQARDASFTDQRRRCRGGPRVALEARGVGGRQQRRARARPSGVSSRCELAGERVQLGEARALGVGHEQLDRDAAGCTKSSVDALAQLLEALAGLGRDEQRVAVAVDGARRGRARRAGRPC